MREALWRVRCMRLCPPQAQTNICRWNLSIKKSINPHYVIAPLGSSCICDKRNSVGVIRDRNTNFFHLGPIGRGRDWGWPDSLPIDVDKNKGRLAAIECSNARSESPRAARDSQSRLSLAISWWWRKDAVVSTPDCTVAEPIGRIYNKAEIWSTASRTADQVTWAKKVREDV